MANITTVTDEQIATLRNEAAAAGDCELVEICSIALGDKPAPFSPDLKTTEACRAECVRTIDYARQEAQGDLVRVPIGLRTQSETDSFAEAMIDEAYWRSCR